MYERCEGTISLGGVWLQEFLNCKNSEKTEEAYPNLSQPSHKGLMKLSVLKQCFKEQLQLPLAPKSLTLHYGQSILLWYFLP